MKKKDIKKISAYSYIRVSPNLGYNYEMKVSNCMILDEIRVMKAISPKFIYGMCLSKQFFHSNYVYIIMKSITMAVKIVLSQKLRIFKLFTKMSKRCKQKWTY